MRFKPQHLLPQHTETSRRKYEVREIDYTNDFRYRTYDSGGTFALATATGDTTIVNIGYSSNGVYLYAMGDDTDTIYQFTMCPYFDISTAVLDDTLDYSTETINGVAFAFNSAGTILVIVEADGTIHEYTVTSWDIGTAVYNRTIDDFPVTNITGISVTTDGDYIVISDTGLTYNMTSPIIANAGDFRDYGSYTGINHVAPVGNPLSFEYNRTGSKVLIMYNSRIDEHNCGTPYRIDTIGAVINTLSISSSCTNLWISKDGTRLGAAGNGKLYVWSISPWSLASPSLISSRTGSGYHVMIWNETGTRVVLGANEYMYNFEAGSPWDVNSLNTSSNYFYYGGSSDLRYKQFQWSGDGYFMYVNTYSTVGYYFHSQKPIETPFHMWSTSSGSISTGVSAEETCTRVSYDGSLAVVHDAIWEMFYYFNIGTASLNIVNDTPIGSNLISLGYSADGFIHYYYDTFTNTVIEYHLTIAFDDSTATPNYDTEIIEIANPYIMGMGYEGNLVAVDIHGIAHQMKT